MRELIFKNMLKEKAKKRDISVEEIVKRDGMVSCTKKRSMYFLRGVHTVKSQAELNEWLEKRKKDKNLNKKFFHILRKFSSQTKEDKLICKMRGSFYVVSGQSIFNIVFVHAIKIKTNSIKGSK